MHRLQLLRLQLGGQPFRQHNKFSELWSIPQNDLQIRGEGCQLHWAIGVFEHCERYHTVTIKAVRPLPWTWSRATAANVDANAGRRAASAPATDYYQVCGRLSWLFFVDDGLIGDTHIARHVPRFGEDFAVT